MFEILKGVPMPTRKSWSKESEERKTIYATMEKMVSWDSFLIPNGYATTKMIRMWVYLYQKNNPFSLFATRTTSEWCYVFKR